MARDDEKRAVMFELDNGIQELSIDHPGHPAAVKLTGVDPNFLRQWAET